MRAIRTATINHNMSDVKGDPGYGKRVTLRLRRDGDMYRWYGVAANGSEYDTETSSPIAAGVDTACFVAMQVWDGSHWDLQAAWIK